MATVPPTITVLFWVIKIVATAFGETTADALALSLPLIIAGLIGGSVFVVTLAYQLRRHTYFAPRYWAAVSGIAIFGTMAADGLHIEMGIPYWVTTPLFAAILGILLATWYRVEGTLSFHSITTQRRALFYWGCVMATFALGTAAGDLTATTFGLGFLSSAFLFTALFLVPLGLWRKGWVGSVAAFWTAYILTRPLGASLADWMGVAAPGGLGFGRTPVALMWGIPLVALIAVATLTREYSQRATARG